MNNFLSFLLRSPSHDVSDSLKPLPYTEEKIIQFKWEQIKQTSNHYKLRTISNSYDLFEVEINTGAFSQITSNTLSKDISYLKYETFENFKRALQADQQHEKFLNWWIGLAYSKERLFQFDFEQGPWDIPWEMLIGLLVNSVARENTAIVRCIGESEELCEGYWTDKLKILIIQADTEDLNLNKNVKEIIKTWNGLESKSKQAVEKPQIINADKNSIIKQLSQFKPHMVWFLGHGSFDGDVVHLYFSKDELVTAEEFSELFDSAKHYPEFAVFWACETGRGTKIVRSEQPNLFAALSQKGTKKGIGTMIGMQSKIDDDAAIVMSTQLFKGLAQGYPLEWAIAKARTFLYEIEGEKMVTMNWAAPVVWSARRPVAHLEWGQAELDHLQLQLLGTISIQKEQPFGAGLEVEPPDTDALNRANDWLPFPITVVRGDKNSSEHKLWYLRTLKGVQAVSEKAVLVIQPEDGKYPTQNLQNWAKNFLDSLEKGRIPEDLWERIDILKNDAEIGWGQLCTMESIFLAVIGPPPESVDWFWDPLFKLTQGMAILTIDEIPYRFKTLKINYVIAGDTVDISQIESALEENSRLLVMLSMLNLPISPQKLKELEFGTGVDEFFENWPDLFIKAFGGYVIRANVRERVLSTTNANLYTQSQFDCLQLTEKIGHAQNPYLKEFRIDLLWEIGDKDMAVEELSNLLHLYRQRNERVPMLRAVENHFKLREGLTSWERLNIAGTYLQFGLQQNARFWLPCEKPKEILDIPFWLSLKAEYEKNEGNIDKAREYIEQAINLSKQNQADKQLKEEVRLKAGWDHLEYRHERARLLHFQERNYLDAAEEYRKIISVINNNIPQNGSSPLHNLLALTHRNLGECILDSKNIDPEDRWREAGSQFQTAIDIEKKGSSFSQLIPEINYQLARLEVERANPTKIRENLERCIETANESRHGLVSTIAKNRLLWLDVLEKGWQWGEIAQQWDLLADRLRARQEHIWATRTLINSNVNVAALLIKENQLALAQQPLQQNLSILRTNNHLDRDGDKERKVKTFAVLQLIANTQGEIQNYWAQLEIEFPDAKQYAQTKGWHNPEQALEGGLYYGYEY